MAHEILNGSNAPQYWGAHQFAPRSRTKLEDHEFACLLFGEDEASGVGISSPWGMSLEDMKQYVVDNPLDPDLLTIHGVGPKRLQKLYAMGVWNMYELAAADPVLVSDNLGVSDHEAEAMVSHTLKGEYVDPDDE